jgi:prepilin-type N-terminal cleavage/methylation domain-containing protein
MPQHKAFTIVELVAVIVVIVILAAILIPTIFGSRSYANIVRSTDAAASLNAAEQAVYYFNHKTAPALSKAPLVLPSIKPDRIKAFCDNGYLKTSVDPNDVQLDTSVDPAAWKPTYQ